MTPGRPSWLVLCALFLVLVGIGLRIRAAGRPGLWGDEIFSLAMATGHSLEHPAAEADEQQGDFVQAVGAETPARYRRYSELDDRSAGPRRVIRAVTLSDTSPPLYYVLLNLWIRGLGASDAALRAFSVWWAVASLPLLWLIGRALGGTRVGWSACLLFSFSPVACFYSVEGRMYAMIWFLVLALVWLTLAMAEEDRTRTAAGLWVVTGAAGLLTHYFFVFVWVACLGWLALQDATVRRRTAVLASVTVLVVLPWYARVPASLARWRVSGEWLAGALDWPGALLDPFAHAVGFMSATSDLGGREWLSGMVIAIAVAVAVGIARGGTGRLLVARRMVLLWGCLLAACAGPLVFDLVRQTTTSTIDRYVLPALPVAFLLVAVALSLLPDRLHLGTVVLLLLAWFPGAWRVAAVRVPRPNQPYVLLDARLEAWARPGDVVLVHSIPSGVVGVARYLRRDVPIVAWVTQLGTRRVPADLERVLRGRRRVALVRVHALASDPLEPWLSAHAHLVDRETFRRSTADILYFVPAGGETFFAPSDLAVGWE